MAATSSSEHTEESTKASSEFKSFLKRENCTMTDKAGKLLVSYKRRIELEE